MNSDELAHYIEQPDGIAKPWLLAQLRLQKLRDRRAALSTADYTTALAAIHRDAMRLGQWWVGIESEVFGTDPRTEPTA